MASSTGDLDAGGRCREGRRSAPERPAIGAPSTGCPSGAQLGTLFEIVARGLAARRGGAYHAFMKALMTIVMGLAVSACVSSGKYEEAATALKTCQDSQGACNTKVATLQKQAADLNAQRNKELVAHKDLQSAQGMT